jgi:hypothetical protein
MSEFIEFDMKIGRHEHPVEHLKADHDVRVFYPDWQVGYVSWTRAPEVEGGGYADVYDSKGVEAGETDEAWCETCGAKFDPIELGV